MNSQNKPYPVAFKQFLSSSVKTNGQCFTEHQTINNLNTVFFIYTLFLKCVSSDTAGGGFYVSNGNTAVTVYHSRFDTCLAFSTVRPYHNIMRGGGFYAFDKSTTVYCCYFNDCVYGCAAASPRGTKAFFNTTTLYNNSIFAECVSPMATLVNSSRAPDKHSLVVAGNQPHTHYIRYCVSENALYSITSSSSSGYVEYVQNSLFKNITYPFRIWKHSLAVSNCTFFEIKSSLLEYCDSGSAAFVDCLFDKQYKGGSQTRCVIVSDYTMVTSDVKCLYPSVFFTQEKTSVISLSLLLAVLFLYE